MEKDVMTTHTHLDGAHHDAGITVKPGRIIWTGLAVIFIAFFCLGAWAALAPLSGAIIADGVIKVESDRQTVQHQEGGIVKEILVRDGDKVEKGQRLIVLDDVEAGSAHELFKSQLDSETAKKARLTAEKDAAGRIDYPAELVAQQRNPKIAEILQRETHLFNTRREAVDTQIQMLRDQIGETRSEIKALHAQIESLDVSSRYLQEQLAASEKLYEKNYIPKTNVLDIKRSLSDYQVRRGEYLTGLSRAEQKIADLELKIVTLRNNYFQNAANELKECTNRIFDLRERLRPLLDVSARHIIRAPVAGDVVDLKVNTIGSAIGPREPLLDIVPKDTPMIVEARMKVDDIDDARLGMPADIHLIPYKQRTTPVVKGKLIYISADRLVDKATSSPYYLIQIEIDKVSLREAGDLKLYPGMPAEVFLKTRERTALQYLIAPVTEYVHRSFREP